MNHDEVLELRHLRAVTSEGTYSFRTPRSVPMSLVRRGFASCDPSRVDHYRITAAGVACLEGGTPSTVRAWCDGCGAVTVHHCLYDHATGERFECAGCAERIAS